MKIATGNFLGKLFELSKENKPVLITMLMGYSIGNVEPVRIVEVGEDFITVSVMSGERVDHEITIARQFISLIELFEKR